MAVRPGAHAGDIELRLDDVEVHGWTPAASELRIRLLLGREPTPALNRALADECRRLAVLDARRRPAAADISA